MQQVLSVREEWMGSLEEGKVRNAQERSSIMLAAAACLRQQVLELLPSF